MILIRHEREPVDGQPVENTFCAVDGASGSIISSSVVYADMNPLLYPARPMQVRIEFDGTQICDVLIGASLARAQQLCRNSGEMSRIYTRCHPANVQLLSLLEQFGFEDNDGLVRMQLDLPAAVEAKVPAGCAVVHDELKDPIERKYFLDRYNQLFNVRHDMSWLLRFIDRPDFTRILTVGSNGMAGEILTWREGVKGIIGYIQTSKRWRRLGVAQCMVYLACDHFDSMDLHTAEVNVRARYPHMLKVLGKTGFRQAELLMRYPGIDINPS